MLGRFFARNFIKKKRTSQKSQDVRRVNFLLSHYSQKIGRKRKRPIFRGESFHTKTRYKPKGVNVIGNALRMSGSSKVTRDVAIALDKCDVNTVLYNWRGKKKEKPSADVAHLLSEKAPYCANVFAINHILQLDTLYINSAPLFRGRYNIGYGAWEVTKFYKNRLYCMNIYDELWAISRYNQQVLSERSILPVVHIPEVVDFELARTYKREDFGLPKDAFIFCYMYDQGSYDRKNPLALVQAFKRAFTPEDNAFLLLKTYVADESDPGIKIIQEAIKGRNDIRIMGSKLPEADVYGLLSVIDCYASLHRAEGFGRPPAEAMKLGKPVVITGFGGPLDYANEKTACLVDFKMIPVENRLQTFIDYEEGAQYADADVDHAVECLRKVASDHDYAKSIAAHGKQWVETHHSYQAAGDIMCERLRLLGLLD